ncbi:MAG: hypothetical protein CMG00_01785 [Candidatus Marinimicrobia bacterium]|nr:hypothetical protein [Candidatus Neomarinimicrobiota bacterium]
MRTADTFDCFDFKTKFYNLMLKKKQSVIITIGDEIITGYRLDTNSNWLAKQLTSINIAVSEIISLPDNVSCIVEKLESVKFQKNIDYCFITGGLGPTNDDKTNEAVKIFCSDDKIKLIKNLSGECPGLSFFKSNTCFFVFPGVPFEFKKMFREEVYPNIKGQNTKSETLNFALKESKIYSKIKDLIDLYSPIVKFSFLPSYKGVALRLICDKKNAILLEEIKKVLLTRLDLYFFSEKNVSIEEVIFNILSEKKLTISTAESCSRGALGVLLSKFPGSSVIYKGGVISYMDSAKTNLLGISNQKISKYGAVSREVSLEMVKKITSLTKSDVGIAITGVSGPNIYKFNKPVGLAYIAIKYIDKIYTKKIVFKVNNRELHKEMVSYFSLNMLRLIIYNKWRIRKFYN